MNAHAQGGNSSFLQPSLEIQSLPLLAIGQDQGESAWEGAEQGYKWQEAWLLKNTVEAGCCSKVHFLFLEVCNNLFIFEMCISLNYFPPAIVP